MNDVWKMWKKGFDNWENATAAYMEEVLKSPLVLGPSGTLLSQAMKARAKLNEQVAGFWGGVGLSTKRDQERTLHALNRLQSQLHDLEERLADLADKNTAAPAPPKAAAASKRASAEKAS